MSSATKHKLSAGYILFIILFTLVAFEIILRVAKHNATYSEQTGHPYLSAYGQTLPTWFYTRPANSSFDVANSEFKYPYKTNSLGLREKEFAFTDTTAKHIICLGDSYTEGYGAPYDSSWPHLMQHYLNDSGIKSEVLNAGVAGSDPLYEFMLFKYKLLSCHPTHLLICVNATDLKDYIVRGDMRRFKINGTTVCRKDPWFEPLYQCSYIARFVINDIAGYTDGNFFMPSGKEKTEISEAAMLGITTSIEWLNTLATKNSCRLEVIIQQDILEFVSIDADSKYEASLFEQMQTILEKKNIAVINLHQALSNRFTATNYRQYTYANDSHYNSAGYNILAQEIIAETNRKDPGFW